MWYVQLSTPIIIGIIGGHSSQVTWSRGSINYQIGTCNYQQKNNTATSKLIQVHHRVMITYIYPKGKTHAAGKWPSRKCIYIIMFAQIIIPTANSKVIYHVHDLYIVVENTALHSPTQQCYIPLKLIKNNYLHNLIFRWPN